MATINTIPHSRIAGAPRRMDLLDTPVLNKGTASSADERTEAPFCVVRDLHPICAHDGSRRTANSLPSVHNPRNLPWLIAGW
jgi:hypothetical protein